MPPNRMVQPPLPRPAEGFHARSADETLNALDSGREGLASAEAASRLERYGANMLPRVKRETPIEAFSSMVPEQVAMMRDGRKTTLPASQLVPGDAVMLASGDKVPAHMRLLDARSLRVEEAALTGESVPAEKQTEAIDAATLAKVGKYLTVAILLVSVAVLAAGTVRTEWATREGLWPSFRETLIFAIALAVGAIPEGLPAIVTIALAIGVQRMARRRAVIRKLPAEETLGSTTVICSDKTGTPTRNEMTVTGLWTPGGGRYAVTGAGYEPKGQLLKGEEMCARPPGDVIDLLRSGALCSDAATQRREERWSVTGDPTEAALVFAGDKLGLDVEAERRSSQRLDAIPFESEHQYMATLNATGHAPTIHLKGAPEVVLARCVVVTRTFVAAALMTAGAIGLFLYEYDVSSADEAALAKAQTMAVTTVVVPDLLHADLPQPARFNPPG